MEREEGEAKIVGGICGREKIFKRHHHAATKNSHGMVTSAGMSPRIRHMCHSASTICQVPLICHTAFILEHDTYGETSFVKNAVSMPNRLVSFLVVPCSRVGDVPAQCEYLDMSGTSLDACR